VYHRVFDYKQNWTTRRPRGQKEETPGNEVENLPGRLKNKHFNLRFTSQFVTLFLKCFIIDLQHQNTNFHN